MDLRFLKILFSFVTREAIVHCFIADLELLNSNIFSIYLQIPFFLLLLLFFLLHVLRKCLFVPFKRISLKYRKINQFVGKYLCNCPFSVLTHPFEDPCSALAGILATARQACEARLFIREGLLLLIHSLFWRIKS